jgi:hypothetical protein
MLAIWRIWSRSWGRRRLSSSRGVESADSTGMGMVSYCVDMYSLGDCGADNDRFIVGKWKGPVPIPTERTLESLEGSFEGEEKAQFLDFVRSLLRWLPEERATTDQAWSHPWVSVGH